MILTLSRRLLHRRTASQFRRGLSILPFVHSCNDNPMSGFFVASFALLSSLVSYSCVSCENTSDIHGDTSRQVTTVRMLELFKDCVKEEQIESNESELIARGKPWSTYHKPTAYPSLIIYPESTEEVSKIMKLCKEHVIPVVAFGGGTSLEGQTLTPQRGISLDFNRMKNIVSLNETDLDW
jgi:hypothetical protein